MFDLDLVNLPQIESVDTPNGRFYTTPQGNKYPSVTTFLSKFSDMKWLDEWKERVGEEQVAKTSTQARRRGTSVHAILEQMVLNNPQYARGQMPNNLAMANSMGKVLRARAGKIKGLELGLWSDNLMIAGRTDMLAEFDNILSIVDFKTAKYNKKESDIESYFLQTTIYGMMVEELLRVPVPQIVVIIGVDFEPAQVFVKKKIRFEKKVLEMAASQGILIR